MSHIVVFYVVQIAACWFALRCGGMPERLVAVALMAAAIATSVLSAMSARVYHTVETFLIVDIALLILMMAIAAVANRFWPIWLSALHLVAIAVHGVKAYDPSLVPWIYAGAVTKMAYPIIALLVVGTERHRRRRASYGGDPDWSAPQTR